jgi:hypothetical protein
MADLTCTAAQVAVMRAEQSVIFDMIAAVALTAGQAVYINSNGKADKADATTNKQVKGIALNAAGAGQAVSVLKEGYLSGFDVSGLAYDAQVMLSATAGNLATTGTIIVGRVVPVPDKALTKALYFFDDWTILRA